MHKDSSPSVPDDLELRKKVFLENSLLVELEEYKAATQRPFTFISADEAEDLLLDIEDILPPPPLNDSQETFLETADIAQTLELGRKLRFRGPGNYTYSAMEVPELFHKYAKENTILVDLQEAKNLADDAKTIILQVQRHFNRPRIQTIAKHYKIPLVIGSEYLVPHPTTPTYPCLPSVQNALLSLWIAPQIRILPDYRQELLKFGASLNRRILRQGRHFYSDISSALPLALEIFKLTPFYTIAIEKKHNVENRKRQQIREDWEKKQKWVETKYKNQYQFGFDVLNHSQSPENSQ